MVKMVLHTKSKMLAMVEQLEKLYIEQFKEHEKNPIVARVLAQETTFEREVEKFYNLSSRRTPSKFREFKEFNLEDEDSQKRGKSPTDLIELLDTFSNEPSDTNKLSYDFVRKDCQGLKIPENGLGISNLGYIAGMSAITLPIGTLTGTLVYALSEVAPIPNAITTGMVVAAGVGMYLSLLLLRMELKANRQKPSGTNSELEEYVKLYKTAGRADHRMNTSYRPHVINELLATDIK